ncbi:hypothetical protein BD311DRAFT_829155 [Dichomitus squalens]|uniref:WW domain-containing protein n=1 Tax=Dichomitus squalens TaxID=114155 RepID=A0A4Q9N3V0_9APHY|nr:hypothetical protein BD311DRAFT_829155 [Dichomitus squalens]
MSNDIPSSEASEAVFQQNSLSDLECPPTYSTDGLLVPMAPAQNRRYARIAFATPAYIKIPRGLHSALLSPEPQYLGVGWVAHFNPEGTQYYVNATKRLVTDDPIDHPDIWAKISAWITRLDTLIETDGMALPDDYEIFLSVATDDDGCKYYFVDHTTQTVFWIEEIDPERHELELPPVCSVAHLRFALQEQYWVHNEYFPHRQVPQKLRKELVDIFRQGRADQLTSENSTFPYSAQQCKHYLQVINVDTECNEYMTWTLARLWGTISRHKFSTFFGEDYAKISREQKRYDRPTKQRTLAVKLCSALLFNMPKKRSTQMDLLSLDDLTYVMHWRDFAIDLLHGWRESSYLAVGLALIGTVSTVQRTNPISAAMGSISIVFSLSGLATSAVLLQWYAGADKFTASTANHLARVQLPRLGYEPIAQAYCLPRALVAWSMIFLAAHVLSAVVDLYGLIIRSPAILLALLVAGGLLHVNSILRRAFDSPVVLDHASDVRTPDAFKGGRSFLWILKLALPKAFHVFQSA